MYHVPPHMSLDVVYVLWSRCQVSLVLFPGLPTDSSSLYWKLGRPGNEAIIRCIMFPLTCHLMWFMYCGLVARLALSYSQVFPLTPAPYTGSWEDLGMRLLSGVSCSPSHVT